MSDESDRICLREGCGHTQYDHTGWRASDPTDKRESCRIIGCSCEHFVIYSYNTEYKVNYPDPGDCCLGGGGGGGGFGTTVGFKGILTKDGRVILKR